MNAKLSCLTAAAAAVLTLAPALSHASGFGPRYSPPAPSYHQAQPVYVPTTVAQRDDRYRRDEGREYRWDRREWERGQWEQYDRRESEERGRFMSRWGRNPEHVSRFEARQARERDAFRQRLEREQREHERREHGRHERG